MPESPWQFHHPLATLACEPFRATLDVTRPGEGLRWELSHPLPEGILGAQLPDDVAPVGESLVDAYARGVDLIATYAQTPRRPFRVQVYWRAVTDSRALLCAVELIVSVQTSLLDSRPAVETVTNLAAAEVWRLTDADQARFERIDIERESRVRMRGSDGTGCFLFRLKDGRSSYVEMVPPTELGEVVLTRRDGGGVEMRHAMFTAGSLEKGVILRARARGGFTDTDGDMPDAARAYGDLVQSMLPLTT